MPGPFALIPHVRIEALPVIPDSQSKQFVAVSDFRFDQAALGMDKSVSQLLTRDSGNVKVDVWMQYPHRSLNYHSELCWILIGVLRNKFFPKRCDFLCQALGRRRKGA